MGKTPLKYNVKTFYKERKGAGLKKECFAVICCNSASLEINNPFEKPKKERT